MNSVVDHKPSAKKRLFIDLVVIAVLVFASAMVFTRDIAAGGFRWGDTPTHAMDGVLIHDWVAAGPGVWLHPIDFAVKQYSYYPTLGMGRPYPPGFAIVEAMFFGIFGVSIPVARLCTACFGIAAVIGVYMVARRIVTLIPAICAASALISIPAVVHWTRQTMLEMPTLAVLIWLVYTVQRYVEKPTWRRWTYVVLLMFAAPLFKQTAVFILPVLGLVFLVLVYRRRIPVSHFISAATLVVFPLILLFIVTLWSDSAPTHMLHAVFWGRPISRWFDYNSLSFYPMWMPHQIGWIILTGAGAGLFLSLRNWDWQKGLLVLWSAFFVLMIICIQHKEPRYLFFGYFPIAMWVGIFAHVLLSMSWFARMKKYLSVALLVGMTVLVVRSYDTPVPLYPNYGDMVADHADKIRGKIIFFEGRRDGDFIFAVRERLGIRQAVVVRGSKILYSCAADVFWSYVPYVSNVEDVHNKLKEFGFNALFVEREYEKRIPGVGLLYQYLHNTSAYARLASVEFRPGTSKNSGQERTVDIYVPTVPGTRSVRFFDIPIPISSQHIRVDLDELASELSDL